MSEIDRKMLEGLEEFSDARNRTYKMVEYIDQEVKARYLDFEKHLLKVEHFAKGAQDAATVVTYLFWITW